MSSSVTYNSDDEGNLKLSARDLRAQRRNSLKGVTNAAKRPALTAPTSPNTSSPAPKKQRTNPGKQKGPVNEDLYPAVSHYTLRSRTGTVGSAGSSVVLAGTAKASPVLAFGGAVNPVTPAPPRRQIDFSDKPDFGQTPDTPSTPTIHSTKGFVNIYPGPNDVSKCICPTEPTRRTLASCSVSQVFMAQYGLENLDYLREREREEFPSIVEKISSTGTPGSVASSTLSAQTTAGEDCALIATILNHTAAPPANAKFLETSERTFASQPCLTPRMRAVLVSWLAEVAVEFNSSDDAFHLAVSILDGILKTGPSRAEYSAYQIHRQVLRDDYYDSGDDDDDDDDESSQNVRMDAGKFFCIRKKELQAVGCVCMWIATKLEDKRPVTQDELSYITDHSVKPSSLRNIEFRVCQHLDFKLHCLTPVHFVNAFLRASNACPCRKCEYDHPILRQVVMYLLSLGRLSSELMYKPPSLITAAAVYLARATLHIRDGASSSSQISNTYWSPTLEHYTGYTPRDLRRSVLLIYRYQLQAEQLGVAAWDQFKKDSRQRASIRAARRVEDLDLPGVTVGHEDLAVSEPMQSEPKEQDEEEASQQS